VAYEKDVRSSRTVDGADHEVAETGFSLMRAAVDLPAVIEEPPLAEVRDAVDA
jgi:hypothetical protein